MGDVQLPDCGRFRDAPGELPDPPIPFDPDRWKSRLQAPGLWPEPLDDCPRSGRWPQVTRADVKAIGEGADDSEGAARLYVAAAVWGTGTKAQGVARRCRPFTENPPGAVGERLADAIGTLRNKGAVEAYDALRYGPGRIKQLGPAFFTKVLYFAGHPGAMPDVWPRPLILDRFVVDALNLTRGTTWRTAGWSTEQYATYLDLAHDWAAVWGEGVEPEVVEAALFDCGLSQRS